MTTLIIISAYILSVFLARWINKINYKRDRKNVSITPNVWFIPVIGILVEVIDLIDTNTRLNKGSWFTGKNW